MCLTFEYFIWVYSPLSRVWTQSITIKYLKHLESATVWSKMSSLITILFLQKTPNSKLQSTKPQPSPGPDSSSVRRRGERKSHLWLCHLSLLFLSFSEKALNFIFTFCPYRRFYLNHGVAQTDGNRGVSTRRGSIQSTGSTELTSHSNESDMDSVHKRGITFDGHYMFHFQTRCSKGRQSEGGQQGHRCLRLI